MESDSLNRQEPREPAPVFLLPDPKRSTDNEKFKNILNIIIQYHIKTDFRAHDIIWELNDNISDKATKKSACPYPYHHSTNNDFSPYTNSHGNDDSENLP